MNLSEKVEETFEKLKPHENAPSAAKPADSMGNNSIEITEEKPRFSLNLEDLRDYLLVLVCFAIALAATFLLVIPQYRDRPNISANFDLSESKLNDLKSQSSYLEGLVGLKEELEANIELADQALPATEDRVPYTLDQVVQIADTSGVEIETLNLGGITDPVEGTEDNLRTVLIQLAVSGSQDEVLQFMYNLENARTIVDTENFQLGTESVIIETPVGDEDETIAETVVQQSAIVILVSYLKEDVDTTVDLSALANSPSYEALFTKLKGMDYYEPTPLNIELGRDNPFSIEESTESFIPFDLEEPITDETEEDASGIE